MFKPMRPLHRITLLSALLSVACLPSLQAASKPKADASAKAVGKAASASAEPKEEEEGKIVGMPIARANGTWLSLRVDNGMFVLSFYDLKKKPLAPDAVRASAKWNPPQKAGNVYCMMAAGSDGVSLVGNKFVTPPHILKVYLSLFDANDKVIESFIVDHRDMP